MRIALVLTTRELPRMHLVTDDATIVVVGAATGAHPAPPEYPIIQISFGIEDLPAVGTLTSAMLRGRRRMKPSVYIWERKMDRSRIAIAFRIERPKPALMAEIIKSVGIRQLEQLARYGEVLALAEATMENAHLDAFLARVRLRKQFSVITGDGSSAVTENGVLDPLATFHLFPNDIRYMDPTRILAAEQPR